jgi:RES domain-containing protein
MDVWRICLARHAADGASAFSGEGSRLYGGRWNSKGVSLVYASSTLSLAALEYLVHADIARLGVADLVSCAAHCPDDISVEAVSVNQLPRGWRSSPEPRALRRIGDLWVGQVRSALLLVPSAIIPTENNVLINPAHPQASRLEYGKPEAFRFDPRLIGSK